MFKIVFKLLLLRKLYFCHFLKLMRSSATLARLWTRSKKFLSFWSSPHFEWSRSDFTAKGLVVSLAFIIDLLLLFICFFLYVLLYGSLSHFLIGFIFFPPYIIPCRCVGLFTRILISFALHLWVCVCLYVWCTIFRSF